MARVQLALNVRDIDASVDFYSKLFGTEPAKVRPGYANFAIADSPLKLVLIEDADQTPGSDQPPRGRGVEHRRGDRGTGTPDCRRSGDCVRVSDLVLLRRPGQGARVHAPGR